MFASSITLVLANFMLFLFLLSLLIAFAQWMMHQKTPTYDILYRWLALLPVGIGGLYTFVMHAFFPDIAAAAIGWQPSPFQFEVAMADLGFGLIAILSFRASYGFRMATVIANACWLWGDAIGHIYQIVSQHNFSQGNAGSWFWMDVIIPALLILSISKLNPRRLAY